MISLFIPIYNEEKIAEYNISQIYDKMSEFFSDFEIIVVNDNSNDNSEDILRSISKKNKRIKYVTFNNGPSRRENLAEAFKLAKGNIIAFMDMDIPVSLDSLKELIESVEGNYDLSTGSRYLDESKIKRTLLRHVISIIYNSFMKLYFRSKVKDHQCGFKAFKKEVIFNLIKELGYDKTFKRGWFWDVELLIRAQRKGYNVYEFPVQWKAGEKSTFNIKRELKMLPYIMKLRFKL